MNNFYYETLNENFEQALKLYETEHTHDELIELIQNGNIVQKHISVLKLDTVNSEHDAQILVSNLINQDGKIREAVSLKLKEFTSDKKLLTYFQNKNNYKIFLDAVIDINGNICRNVISAIVNLKNNNEFCDFFCKNLIELTFNLLDKIEKFDFQEGKYKTNKEVFKLYWCLETIYEFTDKIELEKLKQVILRAKNIKEYTIREKAAKILTYNFNDKELLSAQNELRNDENYYVKRF